jgi:predicted RNA binding protein YcfA (HicA-like mRNA interferase family)
MKVKEVIKTLEADGWYLARTRGSHRQYKHSLKSGTVTVSGKLSVDIPIGTLKRMALPDSVCLISRGFSGKPWYERVLSPD